MKLWFVFSLLLLSLKSFTQTSFDDWGKIIDVSKDSLVEVGDTSYLYFVHNDKVRLYVKSIEKDSSTRVDNFYYPHGVLFLSQLVNEESIKVGDYTRYTTQGVLEVSGSYNNNLQDGMFEFYYANGNLKSRTNWTNGKMDGVNEHFYQHNIRKFRNYYVAGEKNGIETEYYYNGEIQTEGTVVGSKKLGIWKTYNLRGNHVATSVYSASGELEDEYLIEPISKKIDLAVYKTKSEYVNMLLFEEGNELIEFEDYVLIQSTALNNALEKLFIIQTFSVEHNPGIQLEGLAKKEIKKAWYADMLGKLFNPEEVNLKNFKLKKDKGSCVIMFTRKKKNGLIGYYKVILTDTHQHCIRILYDEDLDIKKSFKNKVFKGFQLK